MKRLGKLITQVRVLAVAVLASSAVSLCAHAGGAPQGASPFAAIQDAAARNQAMLRRYSWVSTTQVTYNGEVKDTKVESESYGPDGQLQRNLISDAPAPKPPGLRGVIAERKAADMTTEVESAVALIRSYVPPEAERLAASNGAGNMQLLPAQPGLATLAFTNYNLPNDSLTLTFAIEPKLIQTVDVSTWLDQPSKVVNLVVQFSTLPDGTNYPQTITLSIPSSSLQITKTNSNFQQVVF